MSTMTTICFRHAEYWVRHTSLPPLTGWRPQETDRVSHMRCYFQNRDSSNIYI